MSIITNDSRLHIWRCVCLVPLVLGSALALLKYLSNVAVYSALYGVPSELARVKAAGHWGKIYLGVFLGLTAASTFLASTVFPKRLAGNFQKPGGSALRFFVAFVFVGLMIVIGISLLTVAGHLFR
jgi:hypothetical protein